MNTEIVKNFRMRLNY